jgi:sRNA-binding protein
MYDLKKARTNRHLHDSVLTPLRHLHPGTFFFWGQACSPLKIGIFDEIRERYPALGKKRLQRFLHAYTSTHRYLSAIVLRAPRVDLDGNITSQITDREVDAAIRTGLKKFPNWDDILSVETRYRNSLMPEAAE